jgi:hypothetical protein
VASVCFPASCLLWHVDESRPAQCATCVTEPWRFRKEKETIRRA